MQALLLYNPSSGRSQPKRLATVRHVAEILQSHGYSLKIVSTTHRGSAGDQVRDAITNGAEVIFVCGGDGTVHDVLQGIAGTTAKLAVLPMGSGNALCRELCIPLHPLKAAAAYARTTQRSVRLGVCNTLRVQRYFLLMAGAGPDGALMYRMLTQSKGMLGRWAYAQHALHLLLRSRFYLFQVRYQSIDGAWHTHSAISAMALRLGNLGGIFPGIARGASLQSKSMRLILVRPPAVFTLPLWFLLAWLHLDHWNPWLHTADALQFHCEAPMGKVHAQADGEWIGNLTMSASLDEQSVVLLIPTKA